MPKGYIFVSNYQNKQLVKYQVFYFLVRFGFKKENQLFPDFLTD
jgi:hypothetical protein